MARISGIACRRSFSLGCLGATLILFATVTPAVATVITPFPVPFTATEQVAFTNTAVATFTDDNLAATPADFTATIDWGDGTAVAPASSIGESSAAFVVLGGHTYADEGTFTVTVTISDVSPGTGTATATSTATVTEADALSGTPVNFSAASGASVTPTVGNFTDTDTANTPSDFTASINWGDATVSSGTVVSTGPGNFAVSGTHTYGVSGTFTVTVTLTDDAPGTATAMVTDTANVTNGFTVTAVPFTATEGVSFIGVVASGADANKSATTLAATIDWGDGTSAAGVVTGPPSSFTISGSHTYPDEGTFTVQVTVTETSGGAGMATGSASATVSEADVLTGHAVAVNAQEAVLFSGTVATFTDTNTSNTVADFTATINWGDGTPVSAGTVTGSAGNFSVSGSHTYATSGPFTITVTLADDAPGTATATVSSVATVSAAIAQVPTLDSAGLALLAAALFGGALLLLRRRSTSPE